MIFLRALAEGSAIFHPVDAMAAKYTPRHDTHHVVGRTVYTLNTHVHTRVRGIWARRPRVVVVVEWSGSQAIPIIILRDQGLWSARETG